MPLTDWRLAATLPGMTYVAVTQPTIGQRVTNPYRFDGGAIRSGIIRAVLGNPRYVQVLCDDDIVRTMDTRTLVTTSQEG